MSYSGNPNLKINLVKFWHDSQTCSSIFSYLIHISCIHSYSLIYLLVIIYSSFISFTFTIKSCIIWADHLVSVRFNYGSSGSPNYCTTEFAHHAPLYVLSDKQHSSFEQCTDAVLPILTSNSVSRRMKLFSPLFKIVERFGAKWN